MNLNSTYLEVQDIPNAGRGVIAKQAIPQDTLILPSNRPAAHVVHWEYRKEVCAQCFFYNLGRTLPFRHSATGKVFCSGPCQEEWMAEQGGLVIESWKKLYDFIVSKASAITNNHSLATVCDKPMEDEIESTWMKAKGIVDEIHTPSATKMNKRRTALVPTHVVDPDILSFLLSGTIFKHRHSDLWNTTILSLAQDSEPYKSTRDLEAHSNSYIQLSSLLPRDLQESLPPELCQTLINAASHNAFGIRSGSDDGEEYLGYAVYPEASYFNHSCAPNVSKKRVGATWEFRASREIAEGEQCCITYLGGDERDLTASARRARLRAHWGFECMCLRCVEED